MRNMNKQLIVFLLSLLFVYLMQIYTFNKKKIFWYLYTFTLLVAMTVSILCAQFKDELPTWKYLIFGIGYGTILYGFVWFGEIFFSWFKPNLTKDISNFLNTFGPQNIWHYLLLIFIIVIAEEMFWRGYIQQYLKKSMRPILAVLVATILFSLSLAVSGFLLGSIAAIVAGIILGGLYEWKKSLPLVIVAHIVFVLLLFLILPIV